MADNEEQQMIPTPSDFGHFLLEKELGHGGMGGVYLARDKMLDREVGIKVLLKSLGEDPTFVARFQREAQAAARLNHPNIAQIYSFGQENGMPYIAMELVRGGSLDKDMERTPGALDIVRVMRIGQQIAEALALAAEAGLVHGDVKPENVLFDTDGNAKLVDFGLAAMQGDSSEIWGTPYYISPEKVRRQQIDYRADIYSLGGTLYHALTGMPPFDGPDPTAVVKARFEAPPKKPSEIRPDIPPEVDAIIMRMLELEPSMRYPTYSSLLGDFKRYLAKAGPEKKASTATGTKIKIKTKRAQLTALAGGTTGTVTGITPLENLTAVDGASAEEEVEDKKLGVGAIVGMAVGGIVLLVLIVVGSLMWYVNAEKAREERENKAMIVSKQAQARTAVQNTLKAAEDFAENFHQLVVKGDKEMAETVKALRAELPDEVKPLAVGMLEPPPTKDVAEAIAYTNDLFTAALAAEDAAKNQKAAEEKAAAEASTPATNAVAAAEAQKAGDTNKVAVAAASAGTNVTAQVAAGTNATAQVAAKSEDKKDAKAEDKDAEADGEEAAEGAEEGDGAAAEDAPPPVEVPAAVKQFAELWNDVYFCRAADIRVHGRVQILLRKRQVLETLTAEDVATTEKLAKLSQELLEEYESIKGMKCVEQTQRKASVIRVKSASLLATARTQIQKAKAKAEKIAREKAEAAAKAAAAEKAAAEYKAKAEAETARVQTKFESDIVPRLKRLEWDTALKHLMRLQEDLSTTEGKEALRTARLKIERMQGLLKYFITKGKGFQYRIGSTTYEIAAVTDKEITLQPYKRENKFAKPKPFGKPQKIEWTRFFGKKDYVRHVNEMFNGLVLKGRDRGLGKLAWSNHMFGTALTLQLLYAEVEGAAEMAPTYVQRAVKDFEDCRKTAERLFPDVKLEAAE